MKTVSRTLLLSVLVGILGCASEVDLVGARADLLQTDQDWAAAAFAGTDLDLVASYWSDDAVIFPPEAPEIRGKAAIREFLAGTADIPGFSVSWEPTEVVVSPGGDFGYSTGPNRFTVPDADGNLVTIPGRYVTVWQKQPDGAWKCVLDTWNTEASAPADQG